MLSHDNLGGQEGGSLRMANVSDHDALVTPIIPAEHD
jgi:hypothetical protein